MKKQHILEEIRRTAETNGGMPLGRARFFEETGIKSSDWEGKCWARWGDALREAGFVPNKLQGAYDKDRLIESFLGIIREFGRFPVSAELQLKRRRDPTFPSHNTFNRFGSKSQLRSKVLEYCRNHAGFGDVVPLLADNEVPDESDPRESTPHPEQIGSVYLLKSGRYYKVGKTNAIGRRERELAIQLPEKARTVHAVKTDDPSGIEAYWHTRFAAKRHHGEWFQLDNSDVNAFKRRKFM